ncbi:MAG: RNA 2',3'-cyclic phosphodiesterase [Candidatus Limnocylindrales bacterium]
MPSAMASGGTPWRCYVALAPATAVLRELATRLAPMRAAFPDARWTEPDDVHLTLVFLGSIPVVRVPAVAAIVDDVAARSAPFRLAIGGAGHFGGRGRPRVSWLGVGEGAAAVGALEASLRARLATLPGLVAVGEVGVSFPHLTVARRAPEALASHLRTAFAAQPTVWLADRITLYRSDLGRQGARHEPISSAALGRDLTEHLRGTARHG